MSIVLTGFAQSSYVMTARAALAIKEIEHTFTPIATGDHKKPDHLARHPFGKVPVLSIDGKDLFEASAIVRWADAVGTGPALFPSDPFAAAQVEQWISVTNAYVYGPMVPNYVLKYVFAGPEGPNRETFDTAVPAIDAVLQTLSARIGDPYFVGDTLTAADLFLGPLLLVLNMFPESKALMENHPKLGRLVGTLAQNPKFMLGVPKR